VLLAEHCSHKPYYRRLIGKDPYHVRPPLDLLVQAPKRVVRPNLMSMLYGERRVGEDIFLGFAHQGGQPREAGAEAIREPAPPLVSASCVGLSEDGADGRSYHLLGRLRDQRERESCA
jgi:hypothetical protein